MNTLDKVSNLMDMTILCSRFLNVVGKQHKI